MTGDASAFILYLIILVLPLSALAARRLPAGQVIKLALIWIAIFGAGPFIAYSLT